MTVSPTERQLILAQVNTIAIRDLNALWRQADRLSNVEFAQFVIDAYPSIASQYAGVAGVLAADWYEQSDIESDFQAVPAAAPSTTALSESATWALGATGDIGLARLAGSLQRNVFNGARDTIIDNTDRETGSRWARHASANACQFCKLVATRSTGRKATFYSSQQAALKVVGRGKDLSVREQLARAAGEDRIGGRFIAGGSGRTRGTQRVGDKYHDNCRCVAIEVRPGKSYEPAPYVEKWNDEYIAARKASGSGDVKQILAAWRQLPSQ